ncbi:MAG: tRNA (adenosine(37)-N6)-threonylcarbamoyltransferase complex ATPase subunit type 1 TsaE [Steroidobacteraceae bacterium]
MHARTQTAEETENLGARLARARAAFAAALGVVYLEGGLGAGKTTFARGFARAAGFSGVLRSPTYTLLEVYPLTVGSLVHVDLYRVQSLAELESLGLRDLLLPGHVWLIEWPGHGAGRLPAADLTASFTAGETGHDIEVAAASALGTSWLVQLQVPARAGVESSARRP